MSSASPKPGSNNSLAHAKLGSFMSLKSTPITSPDETSKFLVRNKTTYSYPGITHFKVAQTKTKSSLFFDMNDLKDYMAVWSNPLARLYALMFFATNNAGDAFFLRLNMLEGRSVSKKALITTNETTSIRSTRSSDMSGDLLESPKLNTPTDYEHYTKKAHSSDTILENLFVDFPSSAFSQMLMGDLRKKIHD
jgi:hypothetical protein